MTTQKIKFSVGLFVASGITLAVLVFIWLGMSRYLEKGQYYVTYFNESVQGLDVDSPLKYRGVMIGRVTRIGVAPDGKLIEVVLKVESGQKLGTDIVAQLKTLGITGSVCVELDRKKRGEPDRSPLLSFPTEYPVVASKPSEITELLRDVDEVLSMIKSMDLEGISDKIKTTLDKTSQTLEDAQVIEISSNLNSVLDQAARSLKSADETLLRIKGAVTDNEEAISGAIKDLGTAMHNANTFFEKGSSLIGGADASLAHFERQLLLISQNLERATGNLNHVLELLGDQPSQLLFGQPPVPRKVEPEAGKR